MRTDWMEAYLLGYPGAVMDYKVEWEATRFMVGGKMFAMRGGDKAGRPILTLKCEPAFGHSLREQFPDIIPGYYMNKEHWNSVYLEGTVPEDVVKEMMDMSYRLIRESLPKKTQAGLEDRR